MLTDENVEQVRAIFREEMRNLQATVSFEIPDENEYQLQKVIKDLLEKRRAQNAD